MIRAKISVSFKLPTFVKEACSSVQGVERLERAKRVSGVGTVVTLALVIAVDRVDSRLSGSAQHFCPGVSGY